MGVPFFKKNLEGTIGERDSIARSDFGITTDCRLGGTGGSHEVGQECRRRKHLDSFTDGFREVPEVSG
jgi:hypothetical protein